MTTKLHKHNEERTHEENQERSFVAASHRGDLSIDSRLKSAHKASEIHLKRTGKRLIITRELVEAEANYPEEGASAKTGDIDQDDVITDVMREEGQLREQ